MNRNRLIRTWHRLCYAAWRLNDRFFYGGHHRLALSAMSFLLLPVVLITERKAIWQDAKSITGDIYTLANRTLVGLDVLSMKLPHYLAFVAVVIIGSILGATIVVGICKLMSSIRYQLESARLSESIIVVLAVVTLPASLSGTYHLLANWQWLSISPAFAAVLASAYCGLIGWCYRVALDAYNSEPSSLPFPLRWKWQIEADSLPEWAKQYAAKR